MIAALANGIDLLASGAATSAALTRFALDLIGLRNETLGAFTFIDEDAALASARASDLRYRSGATLGPLDGLPMALKANMAVKDWPQTAGFRFRRDLHAREDAFLTTRLREAGAVVLGLTNMDEGALGAEGMNPWYASTQNPRRIGWSAGGSSSGAAAAVAAGMVPLALGTDTIGSLRIPASFCGVYALKPSYGLLSVRGIVPVHLRFDHSGPIAARCCDLKPALRVLAAHDVSCRVSVALALAPARPSGTAVKLGYGVGLDGFNVTPEVVEAYNRALALARGLGHQLVPIDLSRWDLPRVRRAVLTLCELEMWRVHHQHISADPDDFSDGLRAFIRYGGKLDADDIAAAELRLHKFTREWTDSMLPFDACMLPTTACASFPQRERHPQNTADLTCIASATGCPALSMPLPALPDAMPVGLQIMAATGGDLEVLRLAEDLDAALRQEAQRSH